MAFKSFSFVSKTAKNVLKRGEYLTIPLNAVKHRYFMVSTNGEYFVKLSRILTCASVFLYFDVAQYFHIWRQTMRRQLPCSLYSSLYWTSAEFTVIFGFVKIETWIYKSLDVDLSKLLMLNFFLRQNKTRQNKTNYLFIILTFSSGSWTRQLIVYNHFHNHSA